MSVMQMSSLLVIICPLLHLVSALETGGYPDFLVNKTFSDPAYLQNMDPNQTHLGFIIKLLGIFSRFDYFNLITENTYKFVIIMYSIFFPLGGRDDYSEGFKGRIC
jgi:hypothetical protein